jgi:hypothetical protein
MGPVVNVLGMLMDYSVPGVCSVTMPKITQDLLEEFPCEGVAETPAGTDLFHINASSPLLSPAESKRLHRGIMLMAWIASRVRIDWCVAVGFLRTRVDKLTEEDKTKFYRVIKYINKYPDLKLQLTANQELRLYGWIDASCLWRT